MKTLSIVNLYITLSMAILFTFFISTAEASVLDYLLNNQEKEPKYKMAENVKSVLSFDFHNNVVEVHEFPRFSMTSNFVSNIGTQFMVQGVVGDAPHLHKALDELFIYRVTIDGVSVHEYDYRYFDVNVDFQRDDKSFYSMSYESCYASDYYIETLDSDDYESYTFKSGFAIVDTIVFNCRGVHFDNMEILSQYNKTNFDHAIEPLDYTFVENVRTIATFSYLEGIERMEVHGFETISGFSETNDTNPHFAIEYIIDYYPLLSNAIDNSRLDFGTGAGVLNKNINAKIEFINSEKILRQLDYRKCSVTKLEIVTVTDKEEGFTGKSGFALVQRVEFECSGLNPVNPNYENIVDYTNIMKLNKTITSSSPTLSYDFGTGPTVVATFTFNDGVEMIPFATFNQNKVLVKANPSFELGGIVGDFPLLYDKVDENLSIQGGQGSHFVENFKVDIDIMHDDNRIRGFGYNDCRVTDYKISTAMDNEESYIKETFALENTFTFVCKGYTPHNPAYDLLLVVEPLVIVPNTNNLRDTSDWPRDFYMK